MEFQYIIRTGELLLDGKLFMSGYSGQGAGKNNPNMTYVKDIGPLPCGVYTIGDPYNHPTLGPVCFNLEPSGTTDMFSRGLFRIHADSIAHPGYASHGCIVSTGVRSLTGRQCREAIAVWVKQGTRRLTVVAESADAQWKSPHQPNIS